MMPLNDVVVSGRIRLARNLKAYPFAKKITAGQAEELAEQVSQYFTTDFSYYPLKELSDVEKLVLIEKHMISPDLVKKEDYPAVIYSKDQKLSIMINEEDHLRIQSFSKGFQMEEAYMGAERIDDLLGSHFEYAYDQNYGYITSCPTNIGTGLRASYMLHLPFLERHGLIPKILEEINRFGFTLRGIYGEGSVALGSLYQLSNQKTMGQSEKDMMLSLDMLVTQLVVREKNLRKTLLKRDYNYLEDTIYKSYGILKYAKILSIEEAMDHLSHIKVGINEKIVRFSEAIDIDQLMIEIQPANLLKTLGNKEKTFNHNHYRGIYIKKKLPNII